MAKVLISGGNGLIGKYLSEKLSVKGYEVAILSRETNGKKGTGLYLWNVEKQEIENGALESVDYIIHLAGANIGEKRWTEFRKKTIIDSRIKPTQLLFEKLKRQSHKPKAFISASAIGYYGAITSEKIFTENDQPASDFLGKTCHLWEQAAKQFEELGIRTVKLRTGVVLTKQYGALSKMLIPIKLGIGPSTGSGKQFVPWIHIDDLCDIYIKAIEDESMQGFYNAVAPEFITNKEFNLTLAKLLKQKFWFPKIPAFLLKLSHGEMSAIILEGSRISSERIIKAGYKFKYPNLKDGLTDLLL